MIGPISDEEPGLLFVKRRALLDHLAALPLVYVPGNHDVDLAHFIGTDFLAHPFFARMRAPFLRELGGKQFRFFHGHETDPFNAGDNPGFDLFVILVGVWAFLIGALGVAASALLHRLLDSTWILFVGAGSMLAGLVLLLWPPSGALPLKLALSAYLCLYGAGELVAAVFGRLSPISPARRARSG